MVRNLYYGIRDTSRLGEPMLYSYMVDEFGHASQTPQVLAGFGIEDAMAWRGIPDNMPPVFQWQSPSGEGVRMHRSVHGYGEATAFPTEEEDFVENIDGQDFQRKGVKTKLEEIRRLKERDDRSAVQFWLNGIDHSWAQENLPQVIETLRKRLPDWKIEHSTLEEYTHDLLDYYKENGVEMPVWKGELTHPDEDRLICVSSNRPDQKLRHYQAEHVLEKESEPLAAMAWLSGCEYPRWALEAAWKYILENHAHDSLGCCSVDDVYEAVMERYSQSLSLSQQVRDDAAAYLMSTDSDPRSLWLCSTNSSGHQGALLCEVEIPVALEELSPFILKTEDGAEVPYTVLEKYKVKDIRYNPQYGHPSPIMGYHYRLAVDAGKLPGFTWKKLLVCPGTEIQQAEPSLLPENVMENRFLRVTVQDNGTLELLDKRTGRSFHRLLQLADSGDGGEMYNYRPPMMNEIITNFGVQAQVEKTVDSPVLTEITVRYTLEVPAGLTEDQTARSPEKVPLEVQVVLRLLGDTPRVDVTMQITNHSRFHQLRVLFPSGAKNAVTSFSGQPFDVVERPIGIPAGFNNARDPNCQYHPMEDFCGTADENGGLCIAAKGIYEYECIDDSFRTLALTLGRMTDMERLPNGEYSKYHAEKSFLFTTLSWELSILPVEKGWQEAYPQVLDFVNPPFVMYRRSPDEALLREYEKPSVPSVSGKNFARVEGEGVYLTGMKRAEEEEMLLLRVVNLSDTTETCRISGGMAQGSKFWKVNFMEQKEELLAEGNSCTVTLKPRQIYTVGITTNM